MDTQVKNDPFALLQYLQDCQLSEGHIPASFIASLSKKLGISETEIYSVISFYSFLHTDENITHNLLVSDNITDRMQGNTENLELLENEIGQLDYVNLQSTSCIGMCDQGPALLANGMTIARLDQEKLAEICELVKLKKAVHDWPSRLFKIEDNIRRKGLLLTEPFQPGTSLQAFIEKGAKQSLDEIELSGLLGRGGAGFQTASKWRLCKQTEAEQRYVICNADEGEPGTFKDRVLLNSYAEAMLEGMTLCAGITGATRGYIYLRGEYQFLKSRLQQKIDEYRNRNLLGNNILGQSGLDFEIEIHMGAGAYICGEESALIDSLEGKHGIPRKRPPFPVQSGYRNQPTVVNNVETFVAAARIIGNGPEWFKRQGTSRSTGTKVISISGDCEQPGIYEYPFGTSIRQILDDCKAHDTQAVQIAGAAGHLVGKKDFDHNISFEDFATGGSFMIFDHSRSLFDVIRNFTEFFKHESCGFCTPCRIGTSLQHDLVTKLCNGHATHYDLDELKTIGQLMHTSSHCGLGATASTAVIDLIEQFPQLVERKLAHTDFEPSFDLDAALQQARDITHRNDSGAHIGNQPGEQS